MSAKLFDMPEFEPHEKPQPRVEPPAVPRVNRPSRAQVQLRPISLERLLPADHPARAVWAYVEELDLGAFYGKVRSVEGGRGRSRTDPRILMTLWLFATIEGVGSARALDRLCEAHVAYQWICGGVGVNYHMLADFRTAHQAELDQLLTDSVAILQYEGLVKIERVAQDGMRVRASAGADSFRREKSLDRCLQEAEEQVDRLRRELDEDPAATSKRQQAARKRASEDRAKRVKEALRQLPEVRAKKKKAEKDEARVSTTDPDARVMKMADGGFRPAFNVQLSADTESQVIVGAEVTNVGSDKSQLVPMVEQIDARHGAPPAEVLVDGGFASFVQIEKASSPPLNCVVYAPVQKSRDASRDPHQPLPTDSPIVREWRCRMGTEAAKEVYKQRAATIECVNAIARNRGLRQFVVRGVDKVRSVVLWFALAHNMMRTFALRVRAAASVDSALAHA